MIVGSLGSVAVGALGALVLQVVASPGLQTGELILLGFQGILGVAFVGLWNEFKRQAKHESDARNALHTKVDAQNQEQAARYAELREKFGRLDERAISSTEMLKAQDERLDGLGSKISNQVERGMQSRMEAQDRLIDSVMLRMDNLSSEARKN